jgi:hypothetical protein
MSQIRVPKKNVQSNSEVEKSWKAQNEMGGSCKE